MGGVGQDCFSQVILSLQFPLRKRETELSDDKTETTSQLSGHFSCGGEAVGLHKEPIVGSGEPQQCSHTEKKVVREFRKKF